jgi:hypothetical protein
MTVNVMFGLVGLFCILCFVVIHLLMEKIRKKSCKKSHSNRFNLIVFNFVNIGQIWNKRSSKAKQLIQKMLSKKPEDRITA